MPRIALTDLCVAAVLLPLACAGPQDGANSHPNSSGLTTASAGLSEGTGSDTGTSGDGTSSATEASTDVSTGDTNDTTTQGTTSANPTTTGDATTDGRATDTGEELNGCWGKSPVAWDVVAIDTEALAGDKPTSAMISSDGLTLYYVAGPEGNRRPYRTVRGTRDEPFIGGAIEAVWDGVGATVNYPRVYPDRKEMFVLLADEVAVSLHEGGAWGVPEVLAGPVNGSKLEGHFSLTADSSRLVVQRQDGPVNDQLGDTWRFHEYKRPADAPAGTDYTTFGVVDIPAITDDDYPHVNLCPTISPDGRHLFFGSSYPEVLDPNNLGDALDVFYTSRGSLDAAWEVPVEISVLHEPGLETCPSYVTEDGCVLVFHRFELGVSGAGLYLATRNPG